MRRSKLASSSDMIDLLYSGEVSPCSQRFSESSAYSIKMKELVQVEARLFAVLSEEQQILLTTLTDTYAKLNEIQCQLAYQDGFCTAAELGLDVAKYRNQQHQ